MKATKSVHLEDKAHRFLKRAAKAACLPIGKFANQHILATLKPVKKGVVK